MRRLACLLAALSLGAAPHIDYLLTKEQIARFAVEKAALREANEAHARGDRAACVAALERGLAVERELFGHVRPGMLDWLQALGGHRAALGRFDAALEARREALTVLRMRYPESHWKVIDATWDLTALSRRAAWGPAGAKQLGRVAPLERRILALRRESPAQAATLCREMASLFASLYGAGHPNVGRWLHNAGVLLMEGGHLADAWNAVQQALAIRSRALGDAHPDTAQSLVTLTALLRDLGHPRAAVRAGTRALAAMDGAHGPGCPEAIEVLNGVGLSRADLGDTDAAIATLREGLARVRANGLERTASHARVLNNLGSVWPAEDHPAKARILWDALRLKMSLLGGRHEDLALTLGNLGTAYASVGDFSRGLGLLGQSEALLRARLGPRHPYTLTMLGNMASVNLRKGDPAAALPLVRRVVAARRAVLGNAHPDLGSALIQLGRALDELGDPRDALPAFEEAARISLAAGGEANADYGLTLLYRAGTLVKLGRVDEADALLGRALRRERRLGAPSPSTLDALGLSFHKAGHHAEAARLMAEALAMKRRVGTPPYDLSTGVQNLAAACFDAGRTAEASRLFSHALDLQGSREDTFSAHDGLGRCLLRAGDPARARRHAEVALAEAFKLLEDAAPAQSERQQMGLLDQVEKGIWLRLAVPEAPGEASAVYAHVLRFKGLALAHQQHRRRFARLLAEQDDPRAAALLLEIRGVTERLAGLALSPERRGDAGHRAAAAEALDREREALEAALARIGPGAATRPAPASPAALARALPEGAALIDLFIYVRQVPDVRPSGWRNESALAAWVVRPGRPPVRVELGTPATLFPEIISFRNELRRGGDGGKHGAELRNRLWLPLEKHLAGAETVLIAPDGALCAVPFAALPGARPGTSLLEERALAVVPVPALLPALLGRGKGGPPSLLVVGDVDFRAALGAPPARLLPGADADWPELPGTRDELASVAAAFRARVKGPVEELRREWATREAVRAGLQRRTHAHLATHGFFRGRPGDERGGAIASPAMRSGLILAGGGRGTLTALEVAELDLSGLELAVLSACETGLGEVSSGEGVLGLQRAFQVAGTRTTITSLWSVDDAATAVLMERFYLHLWKEKKGKLDALRLAQVEVMRHPEWVEERARRLSDVRGVRGAGKTAEVVVSGKKVRRSPPAWWAGFVLSGDWR